MKATDHLSGLTVERARSLLSYDPLTGILRWKVSRGRVRGGTEAGNLKDGYIVIKVDGREYLAHRLAWLIETGTWPTSEIDHHDEVKSNNRRNNLRECVDGVSNQLNIKAPRSDNTSGIRGVSWHEAGQGWIAQINLTGKPKSLGIYASPLAAGDVYETARAEAIVERAKTAIPA